MLTMQIWLVGLCVCVFEGIFGDSFNLDIQQE